MATLIVHAPRATAKQEGKRSFDETLTSGVGTGYGISKADCARLQPGSPVVVLSKDQKLRAEGVLVGLSPTAKAGNGLQRYDVRMRDLQEVAYQPETFNRNGVKVV